MKASQILEKYPINSIVTDANGVKNCQIRNHNIQASPFEASGSLLLGGVLVYSAANKKWAEIINN